MRTDEDRTVEVLPFFEGKIESIAFVLTNRADGDVGQRVRLAKNWRASDVQG